LTRPGQFSAAVDTGHAFILNVRRGHYELGAEEMMNLRVWAAFDKLAMAI
jgi:hypothetical protein